MVKFGKHIEVFNETDNESGQYYVVPYNDIKAHIRSPQPVVDDTDDGLSGSTTLKQQTPHPPPTTDRRHRRDEFVQLWRECLACACDDFSRSTQQFWQCIFAGLASAGTDEDVLRGALPGTAISLYVQQQLHQQQQQQQPPVIPESHNNSNNNNVNNNGNVENKNENPQELLVWLKKIYEVSYHNTEALRKLVKKYDKHRTNSNNNNNLEPPLSPELLPLVYSANFTVGQPNLELGIDLLRQLLLRYDDHNNASANDYHSDNGVSSVGGGGGYESDQSNHDSMVQVRQAELDWLERLTQSMEPWELDRLVAHRYVTHCCFPPVLHVCETDARTDTLMCLFWL